MPSILVVDDAQVDRRLACKLLTDWLGTEVREAEDGHAALDAMKQQVPALVITDMQMPRLDGLELVRTVRENYPQVPVVLMTAHGSEEVATAALRAGAASYVPKHVLARDLIPTVERLLAVSDQAARRRIVTECLTSTQRRFSLDNDTTRIQPLIHYLRQDLMPMDLCDDTELMRIGVALDEALRNAIHHGNLEVGSKLRELEASEYASMIAQRAGEEPYCNRRVEVAASLTREEARFCISDEGPGFDPSTLPDPTDPMNIEKLSGRGLLLIRTFMDEVTHDDGGRTITMVKRRQKSPGQGN